VQALPAQRAFSGGTIVGLHMIRRRPDLFTAYVGSGQIVDWARQDTLSYALLLQRATALGNAAMLADLEMIGPPPYADTATDAVKSKYAGAPAPREAAAFAELMPLMGAALKMAPEASYHAAGLKWPEPLARSFSVYTALRRQIVTFDARGLGLEFTLPMFFLQGEDDVFTVTEEVRAYVAELTAPHAELLTIAGARPLGSAAARRHSGAADETRVAQAKSGLRRAGAGQFARTVVGGLESHSVSKAIGEENGEFEEQIGAGDSR
jgi:pimeloyl-ACP methyl ester carboxylesterase